MTLEETQAALSGPRTAGLAAAGLLPLAYRRFWATRMHALGTVVLCQAGPREFVAGSYLGESMACHLVTPELPDADAVTAALDRDTADARFGRAWAGEWVAVPRGSDVPFTRR